MLKIRKKILIAVMLVVVAALCSMFAISCSGGKYTVSFDTDGHGSISSMKKVEADTVIVLPEPEEEEGYVFDGWYLEKDYSGASYAAGSEYTVTGDTTFYGKFIEGGYITLELDGWTLPEGSKLMMNVGENVANFMKDYVPTKEHYLFDEWLYEGKSISNSLVMPSGGLTLTIGYKIEVVLQAMVKELDGDNYVREEEFDIVDYDYVGSSHMFDEPAIPGLSLSSNNTFNNGELKVSVTDDYTKNVLAVNYERNTLTYRLLANYPSDSGMQPGGNNILQTGTLTFGQSVDIYMELSCPGYLFAGWATVMNATEPEYAVDSISPYLQTWDADANSYVVEAYETQTVEYAPSVSEALYAVWIKGYVNMHGNNDVIYMLESDVTKAYLYRGGYFFENTQYYASSDEYYFGNLYTGNDQYYCVKLREDGLFSIYSSSHFESNVYYRYYDTVSWSSGSSYPTLSSAVDSAEYLRFGTYDNVYYYVNNSQVGEGTYTLDGSECHITIERGDYAGRSFVAYLTYATYSSGTTEYIFIERDDAEAEMGYLTIGGLYMNDDGSVGEGYYYTDYMFLLLDGYGECIYYDYINGASYYYSYLEDDILWLFSSSGSYAGSFRAIDDAWYYYYPMVDSEFELQDENGDVVGTIKMDGACYATVTENGEETEGFFEVGSLIIGDAVVFYHDKTWNEYLLTYNSDYTDYAFRKVPGTYVETYYLDSEGLYYQALVLNQNGSDDATYYVYAYDAYYGAYYYYPILTGTYKTYTNDTYGFTYYVFSVDSLNTKALWDEYDQWWDYYIYDYAALCVDLDVFKSITEVGFIVDTAYFFDSTYDAYYAYNVDVWLWYSTQSGTTLPLRVTADDDSIDADVVCCEISGAATLTGNKSSADDEYGIATYSDNDSEAPWLEEPTDVKMYEEYTGSITLGEKEYSVSMLVAGGYFVFVTEVVGDETSNGYTNGSRTLLLMDGIISGYVVVEGSGGEYTACILYLWVEAAGTTSDLEDDQEFVIIVGFDTGEMTFTQYTEETYYIYAYDGESGEASSTEYMSYNYLDTSDEMLYSYTDGTNNYTGKIEEYGTTVSGVYLYKFTQTENVTDNNPYVFYYVLRYLDDGSTVFMKYDINSSTVTYTGEDGSSFTEDGLGYGALYKDASGSEHVVYVGYTYYIVKYDSVQTVGEGTGAYGYGFIELYADGEYIYLDFEGNENYTLRGNEYGLYMLADNQLFEDFLILDGYSKVYVVDCDYDVESGTYGYTRIGEGTYSLTDTVVELSYSYTGSSGQMAAEGVIDGYYIHVFNENYAMSLVDNTDWSVFVLDGAGNVTAYLANGGIEYGSYTLLDDSYFYYISDDGDTMGAYGYSVANSSFEAVNYSTSASSYYTSDMSSSVLFTDYGRVSFDDGSYYYYVMENGKAYIYYLPADDSESVNKYGYVKSEGYDISQNTVTVNGSIYYSTRDLRLSRKDKSADYGYLYGSSTYELSDIVFSPSGATYSGLEGRVYYYSGLAYATNYYLTAYFYRQETDGGYEMYFAIYTIYNSYEDYCLYNFTVDLSAGTYEITAMELDTPFLSYDYMYYFYMYEYYMYYSNYYYDYFYQYYYYYLYYGDSTYYYYAMQAYEYSYEYYEYAIYYYDYFMYYYAEIDMWWTFDGDMNITGTYASGIILPYLIEDEDGYAFYFDSVEVTYVSSGYYMIEFENYDGNTYQLTFVYYTDFINYADGSYFQGFLAFDVYSLERMYYDVETNHSENESYYGIDIGVLVFSEYYYDYIGDVWSIGLTYYAEGGADSGEEITILTFFELDDQEGALYLASKNYDKETGYYSSTQYYTLMITWDGATGDPSVTVKKAENVVTYMVVTDGNQTGDGYSHMDVVTYTDKEGSEVEKIILVYVADVVYDDGNGEEITSVSGTYYVAYDCENESDGSFVFEIYDSSVGDYVKYSATLTTSGENNTATFAPYEEDVADA